MNKTMPLTWRASAFRKALHRAKRTAEVQVQPVGHKICYKEGLLLPSIPFPSEQRLQRFQERWTLPIQPKDDLHSHRLESRKSKGMPKSVVSQVARSHQLDKVLERNLAQKYSHTTSQCHPSHPKSGFVSHIQLT